MEVIAVATHNERFYDSYIDSFKKYNIEPTILGWGKHYTGHLMKDDLLEEYLSTFTERKVILFTDAFDSIIVRDPINLYNKFINSGHNMIISNEETKESMYFIFQKFFFGGIDGELINTGLIIGYSDIFLQCLRLIKKYRRPDINSNQKIWTIAFQNEDYLKNNIHIDSTNEYFHNHNVCSINIKIENDMVYLPKKDTYPYVIQFNGNNDLNHIAKQLNIKQSDVKSEHVIKYYFNAFKYYGLPYVKYIVIIVLIIILLRKN